MWSILVYACLLPTTLSKSVDLKEKVQTSIFTDDQIVFSSSFNITKILVPADGKYVQSNDMPTIFFTIADPKMEGGSCIYVLEGLAAYEVLEGGRDTTADYGNDKSVYLGAKDGIYKYNPDSLSAKKYGLFRDDIIQLQKANGSDMFYILTADKRIYKLENNATVKTRLDVIICAKEFVLDMSNNIYYIDCRDNTPHIVLAGGLIPSLTTNVMDDFKSVKLLRPAFVMENCIPFFGDGSLYILYANGSFEKKDFSIKEQPSAFSVDAALYLVAALDGKIYEFNVMEVLLKSMFGIIDEWPRDVTKIVISMMESAREGVMNYYTGWNHLYQV